MKQKIRSLVTLSLLSLAGTAQAMPCVSVGADALYWHPCTPVFRYAVRQEVDGAFTRNVTKPIGGEYDWGFRVRAAYRIDNCTIVKASYYRVEPSYSGSTLASGAALIGPAGNNTYTRVDARESSTFQEANLKLRMHVWEGRCATLYGALGLRWLDVKDRREATGFAPNGVGRATGNAEVWGAGAVVQAGLCYRIFSCLKLSGELGLSGLAGRRSLSTTSSAPAAAVISSINYGSDTACFPGLESRLGLKYHRRCGAFNLSAHVAWDQRFYLDAMRFGSAFDVNPASVVETIGLSGLVLGATVGY